MNISHPSSPHRRPPLSAWRLFLTVGLTLLALGTSASAVTYYVKNGGNDLLDGLTDANAWATIGKVNGTQLAPGDRILFKRGSTWTGTQLTVNTQTLTSEGQRVIYGSYSGTGTYPGTGALPIITTPPAGQKCVLISSRKYITVENLDLRNGTNGLSSQSSNFINVLGVVTSNHSSTSIVFKQGGNILVDGCTVSNPNNTIGISGILCNGSQNEPLHDVTIRNCVVHDVKGDGFTLHDEAIGPNYYSLGNNFTLTDNVAYNCSEQGFDITSAGAVTLSHNESYSNNQGGMTIGHSANNITVRYHNSHDEPAAATGSNIKISVDTVTVEYSKFVGNTTGQPVVILAPTLDPGTQLPDGRPENVTLRNNTFVWNSASNGNIFLVTTTSGFTSDTDNLTMKNNIWANRSTGIPTMNFSQANRPPNYATYAIRNNLYDDAPVTAWRVGSTNYANFAAYKAAYNPSGTWLEKTGNPGFVSNSDYRLASSGSPAYNAAENIGLTVDFNGVSVPQGGARDMGLYELPVSGPPSAPSSLTASASSSTQVDLSWPDVADETGYRIQRKIGTGAYGDLTTKAANSTAHSDTTVSANTSYTYQIRAESGNGNSAYTVSNSVTTPTGGSPVTHEAESLTETHSSGDTVTTITPSGVSGSAMLLTGSAVGDWVEFTVSGVSAGTHNVKVQFHRNAFRAIAKLLVDGNQLGSPYDAHSATAGVVEIDFGSVSLSAGNHAFRFEVTGRNAGSSNTTNYQVAVDYIKLTAASDTTPPTVSITAPAAGTVTGSIAVSANASDNVGVAGVQFKLDGANLGAEDTASPYSVTWNTSTAAPGSHALTAVARDAAGNTTTSTTVNVTVADQAAPTVSITAPVAGNVNGSVAVSANASDNVGVVGVQFKLDGGNLSAEDTTSPYSVTWDTTTVGNGAHALTAVARDAAGNTTTSATVNVTVNNAPIVYDANALTISASSGDGSATVGFTGASNNDFLRYDSNQIGDFVSFNVNVPVANIPYAISVKYHENDYRGIVQLLIDGSNQDSAFDAHKENPAQLTTVALGSKTFTTTGNHTFRFQITNKNAGSQDFQIGIDTITLTP